MLKAEIIISGCEHVKNFLAVPQKICAVEIPRSEVNISNQDLSKI
jgi:hypothetical protein